MLAGNYAAALPLLREAVAGLADPANPVTAYANFNLGQTLVQLGQCTSAIPYLQRAEQLEPTRHEVKDAIRYAEQCAAGGPAGPGQNNGHGNQNGNQND
jgi:tetratricopeptide (TPR) repeat protein